MSAVSYVGSYLARARFISADTVVAVLKRWLCSEHRMCMFYAFIHLKFMLYLLHRLVEWCDSYCKLKRDPLKPIDHQIFYASCQVCCGSFCIYLAKQEKNSWSDTYVF